MHRYKKKGCFFLDEITFTFSLCFTFLNLFLISGIPQHPLPEAKDSDYSEGKEDYGQIDVKEADVH